MWHGAIMRALEKRGAGDRLVALDALASKLLDACGNGDLAALKEFGDRLDGKPAQSLSVDAHVSLRKASEFSDDQLADIAAAAHANSPESTA